MLNKVMLIGNLGRDPEVRHLENGAAVAKFSIATNERYKDKSGEYQTLTEWHDIIMWRGLAELAEKLLTKGRLVYVEGKLTTRKWQDQNGQERRTTEVVANTFQLLDRKDSPSSGGSFPGVANEPASGKSLPVTERDSSSSASSSGGDSMDMPDDDLPF